LRLRERVKWEKARATKKRRSVTRARALDGRAERHPLLEEADDQAESDVSCAEDR
jgi:hypothetical protein